MPQEIIVIDELAVSQLTAPETTRRYFVGQKYRVYENVQVAPLTDPGTGAPQFNYQHNGRFRDYVYHRIDGGAGGLTIPAAGWVTAAFNASTPFAAQSVTNTTAINQALIGLNDSGAAYVVAVNATVYAFFLCGGNSVNAASVANAVAAAGVSLASSAVASQAVAVATGGNIGPGNFITRQAAAGNLAFVYGIPTS